MDYQDENPDQDSHNSSAAQCSRTAYSHEDDNVSFSVDDEDDNVSFSVDDEDFERQGLELDANEKGYAAPIVVDRRCISDEKTQERIPPLPLNKSPLLISDEKTQSTPLQQQNPPLPCSKSSRLLYSEKVQPPPLATGNSDVPTEKMATRKPKAPMEKRAASFNTTEISIHKELPRLEHEGRLRPETRLSTEGVAEQCRSRRRLLRQPKTHIRVLEALTVVNTQI